MSSLRFTEEDFRTFTIEGLDARMSVLKDTVRRNFKGSAIILRLFCPL